MLRGSSSILNVVEGTWCRSNQTQSTGSLKARDTQKPIARVDNELGKCRLLSTCRKCDKPSAGSASDKQCAGCKSTEE